MQSAERDESVQRDEEQAQMEQAQMEQKREGTIWELDPYLELRCLSGFRRDGYK